MERNFLINESSKLPSVIDGADLNRAVVVLPSDGPQIVTPATPRGGLTANPSSGLAVPITFPAKDTFLNLMSLKKSACPVVTANGMTVRSVVDLWAYLDPSSFFSIVTQPERELMQFSLSNQNLTIDNTGAFTNLAVGTRSVSLQNIDCFGFLFIVDALNTMSGQNALTLNIVDNLGNILNTFQLQLEDVNATGMAYVARTARAISASMTQAPAGAAPFGAFPNNQQIVSTITNRLQSDIFKLIIDDADAPSSSQNYVVVEGLNASVQVLPVPITPETKFAFFEHYFRGMLDQWPQWIISRYVQAKSFNQVNRF